MGFSRLDEIMKLANGEVVSALETLKDYLRLPSISARNFGIPETVDYVVQMIREAGGEARILDDLGGNPVVYGFFAAGEEGDAGKTLLFYNHYDVQPPEPLDEWKS
ncbi:MAG TPA: acetylornithine deacetylase, partial [Bacillaceae bacterium]